MSKLLVAAILMISIVEAHAQAKTAEHYGMPDALEGYWTSYNNPNVTIWIRRQHFSGTGRVQIGNYICDFHKPVKTAPPRSYYEAKEADVIRKYRATCTNDGRAGPPNATIRFALSLVDEEGAPLPEKGLTFSISISDGRMFDRESFSMRDEFHENKE